MVQGAGAIITQLGQCKCIQCSQLGKKYYDGLMDDGMGEEMEMRMSGKR